MDKRTNKQKMMKKSPDNDDDEEEEEEEENIIVFGSCLGKTYQYMFFHLLCQFVIHFRMSTHKSPAY